MEVNSFILYSIGIVIFGNGIYIINTENPFRALAGLDLILGVLILVVTFMDLW